MSLEVTLSNSQQPTVTVTQPKVAFVLSLITLGSLVYMATDKVVRHQIEFDALKASYAELSTGQLELKDEVKSLRNTVDNEIRHMAQAVNRLSIALEESSTEVSQ